MKPHFQLLIALLLAPVIAVHAGDVQQGARPNFLFIVADDLGWADVGWHGSSLKTPHLDRLVNNGVELDSHYVQPVCTPTRVALLSGRWTSRWGRHVLLPSNLRAFPPDTVTLAGALRSAGYETYMAGKWHLGSRPEWGPNHYGFDHSYGSLAGAIDPWTHQYRPGPYMRSWHRDGTRLDEPGNATELVARQVNEWIRARHGKPWFIYVPFQAVHIPIDAPKEYKRLYQGQGDSLRRYGGFVSQMDAKVGEFVASLEATGQRGNTLIVFTSDNGGTPATANPYAGNTPPLNAPVSSNRPLRGYKAQLYEGGIRVPAFVNWPGRLEPRKVTTPLHAVDWMPTLTKLAGFRATKALKWDGQDIWPLLAGEVQALQERAIYIPLPNDAAVRVGDWKLIRHEKGNNRESTSELFNLADDPYEKKDCAATEPARANEMLRVLTELRKDDLLLTPAGLEHYPE